MTKKKETQWTEFEAQFIKNDKGKVTGVVLEIKDYEGIIRTVAKWQAIKKKIAAHKKKERAAKAAKKTQKMPINL